MSSEYNIVFTKDNLDKYLRELGKQFRKLNGERTPAEIVLIGGAAVLASYGFREMTTDIDAIIHASTVMKDAINYVGDKYGLPNGWLNSDFVRTASYSTRLEEISTYYRTFSNVLTIRVVSKEYLVAMKLKSGRRYRSDFSDIVGILAQQKKNGDPLTKNQIVDAYTYLYDNYNTISEYAKDFIDHIFEFEDYEKIYFESVVEEAQMRNEMQSFDENYPGVIAESNVNELINLLRDKKKTNEKE